MTSLKISKTELELRQKLEASDKKLRAAYSIKRLLAKIDHSSEVVPMSNSERLIAMLSSLKKGPLDNFEKRVVYELVNL